MMVNDFPKDVANIGIRQTDTSNMIHLNEPFPCNRGRHEWNIFFIESYPPDDS